MELSLDCEFDEAAIYKFEPTSHQSDRESDDEEYFSKCMISSIALYKMTSHAVSGGSKEVMGIMIGKVMKSRNGRGVMCVMDSFALPVEGTEVRVNAHEGAYEYMCEYITRCELVHRPERAIGWYHSHPGYGCWLSGIDVQTQEINQRHQDPWLAIVVDPIQNARFICVHRSLDFSSIRIDTIERLIPFFLRGKCFLNANYLVIRTIASKSVDIGAFRTYVKGKPVEDMRNRRMQVPEDKIDDFGCHFERYYSLDITYFGLDKLTEFMVKSQIAISNAFPVQSLDLQELDNLCNDVIRKLNGPIGDNSNKEEKQDEKDELILSAIKETGLNFILGK
ncbi:hypothetical protein ACOME3_005525 [Neoechinorhynchus agilis]